MASYGSVPTIMSPQHPYHIQLRQELLDDDFRRSIYFRDWAQRKIHYQKMFFDYVLFSDEATFCKNGM